MGGNLVGTRLVAIILVLSGLTSFWVDQTNLGGMPANVAFYTFFLVQIGSGVALWLGVRGSRVLAACAVAIQIPYFSFPASLMYISYPIIGLFAGVEEPANFVFNPTFGSALTIYHPTLSGGKWEVGINLVSVALLGLLVWERAGQTTISRGSISPPVGR